METVPFSQGFKDDRMTTWRFLSYSMQFSEHSIGEKCFLKMKCADLTYMISITFPSLFLIICV